MEMDFLSPPNTSSTSSIFSFDQVDEFFQLPPLESLINQQEDIALSPVLQEGTGLVGCGDPVVIPSPRQQKQRSQKGLTIPEMYQNPNGTSAATAGNKSDKKIIHRDVERQRRQEMASLYRSLRSHLPLEYIKGKRSISDHIHETVKYIRHLQNEIQVLSEKRDELKRMTESKGDQTNAGESSEVFYDSPDIVMINPCMEGVEVMVNTSWRQGILQSRILQVLMRGGLSVISFNSAQTNERVVYSIQAEVESQGDVNLAKLRQKLMNLRA